MAKEAYQEQTFRPASLKLIATMSGVIGERIEQERDHG